jgi:hypothetical protein
VCLPQVIKSFQNYRSVATNFYPTLVCVNVFTYVIFINASRQKEKLSLCLTNYALLHEDVWGNGCMDPRILDLGTSFRSVVSLTPRPLYLRVESPRYPLDRRLGGPQSRSGHFRKEKIFDPTGTRPPTPRPSSPYPVAIPTTLSRLHISAYIICIYVGYIVVVRSDIFTICRNLHFGRVDNKSCVHN